MSSTINDIHKNSLNLQLVLVLILVIHTCFATGSDSLCRQEEQRNATYIKLHNCSNCFPLHAITIKEELIIKNRRTKKIQRGGSMKLRLALNPPKHGRIKVVDPSIKRGLMLF